MREGRFYKFWVYIIASPTGTLYIGMTGFIDTRIFQHRSGEIDGFTKKYKCNRLVYYEQYDDVYVAKRRERQLKGWRREKKIALIEKMNPRWEDLAERQIPRGPSTHPRVVPPLGFRSGLGRFKVGRFRAALRRRCSDTVSARPRTPHLLSTVFPLRQAVDLSYEASGSAESWFGDRRCGS